MKTTCHRAFRDILIFFVPTNLELGEDVAVPGVLVDNAGRHQEQLLRTVVDLTIKLKYFRRKEKCPCATDQPFFFSVSKLNIPHRTRISASSYSCTVLLL